MNKILIVDRFDFRDNIRNSVSKYFHLVCYVLFFISGEVSGQSYNVPYDIPRFQSFISGCKLQAPTSATIATSSDLMNGYTSEWFYVIEEDKIAMRQSGESMRTEFRHQTNWNLLEGDRSFHGRLKVEKQTCDQVTVVQIHDDANAGNGPNKPLLRIYKHLAKSPANHLWAAIKTDVSGTNTTHIDLGLAPTEYFDWDVILEGGNLIINIDGIEKVNENVSFWSFPSYWKAGVYLQDNGEAIVYFDELYLDGRKGEVLSSSEGLSTWVTVFPNPTDLFANIDIDDKSFMNGTITLFNLTGVIQRTAIITDQKMEFRLPEENGMYLLKIENGGTSKTLKVIKKTE